MLCDEILSALDVSVQTSIVELLRELQAEQGIAYLFISHDLAVVRSLSHRVGVLYLGELCEVGTAEEVYAPPYHPYTHMLLSAVPEIDGENAISPAVRSDPGVVLVAARRARARSPTAARGRSARSATRWTRRGGRRATRTRSAATSRSTSCPGALPRRASGSARSRPATGPWHDHRRDRARRSPTSTASGSKRPVAGASACCRYAARRARPVLDDVEIAVYGLYEGPLSFRELADRMPSLRWIHSTGAGIDSFVSPGARRARRDRDEQLWRLCARDGRVRARRDGRDRARFPPPDRAAGRAALEPRADRGQRSSTASVSASSATARQGATSRRSARRSGWRCGRRGARRS